MRQPDLDTRKNAVIETLIPARLDRLPWGRFHTLVAAALGVTWILDGLEVTLAGATAGALQKSSLLHFSESQTGLASSAYLAGAVLGALLFGWLTDRLGRKLLFFVTLSLYLVSAAVTAFSWDLASFCFFRFLTGAGIGGEYSAVNSTIQEMIPARYRGWTDLVLNGSFWAGAAIGAVSSIFLLDPANVHPEWGWRLAFLSGAVLGLVIIFFRRWIPESPRWLVIHGREAEGEAIVSQIEAGMRARHAAFTDINQLPPMRLRPRTHTPLREVFHTIFVTYRRRALAALALMAAQAFFYNAIFFTYAPVLTRFYGVSAEDVGWYLLPFALANVFGPVLLGRFFDTIGRRQMIAFTYTAAALLLAGGGLLFAQEQLTATWQMVMWMMAVFFFASPAAGAAYLTVSEIFPVEIRALAIAAAFAVGTAIGGVGAPFLLGSLVETGSRLNVFYGYALGSALMLMAAAVEVVWGIAAERKPLESVARPLSSPNNTAGLDENPSKEA